MREMFWDLSKDVDVDVLACNEAIKLLHTMTEVSRYYALLLNACKERIVGTSYLPYRMVVLFSHRVDRDWIREIVS